MGGGKYFSHLNFYDFYVDTQLYNIRVEELLLLNEQLRKKLFFHCKFVLKACWI